MPLIPYADTDRMEQEHPAAHAAFLASGRLNISRMWANAPEGMVAGMAYGKTLKRHTSLDPACQELLILAVARLEGGVYEWVQHVPMAERAGCSPQQIAAIERGAFDAPAFDARQRAMLALITEVVRKVRASEETVAAARRHFTVREIIEMILISGMYMSLARLTETVRVDVDPPPGVAVPAFGRMG